MTQKAGSSEWQMWGAMLHKTQSKERRLVGEFVDRHSQNSVILRPWRQKEPSESLSSQSKTIVCMDKGF